MMVLAAVKACIWLGYYVGLRVRPRKCCGAVLPVGIQGPQTQGCVFSELTGKLAQHYVATAAFFPLGQLGITEKDLSGVFNLYFVFGRIAELKGHCVYEKHCVQEENREH